MFNHTVHTIDTSHKDVQSDYTSETPLSSSDFELYGIDDTIYCYAEDDKNEFVSPDGSPLKGERLMEYLRKSNRQLCDKADYYRRQYENVLEEIGETKIKANKQIARIRDFYRNMIFLSNSRSAVMYKKAIGNSK